MLVVSDAGPIHYLVFIGQIRLLPHMFGGVSIPTMVRDELNHPQTPDSVRALIAAAPSWLSVVAAPLSNTDMSLAGLDDGERATITLAMRLRADLILMDDRAGVTRARAKGLEVTGTLGLLDRAARQGLIDLAAAFEALGETNFHSRPEVLDTLLAAWRKDRGD